MGDVSGRARYLGELGEVMGSLQEELPGLPRDPSDRYLNVSITALLPQTPKHCVGWLTSDYAFVMLAAGRWALLSEQGPLKVGAL
jgi:hypothetical protein